MNIWCQRSSPSKESPRASAKGMGWSSAPSEMRSFTMQASECKKSERPAVRTYVVVNLGDDGRSAGRAGFPTRRFAIDEDPRAATST